jgi:hypothetical protein
MGKMKDTAFFSLPSKMLGSIPSGGSSVFNVDFGRFGRTTFDLASFGSAIDLLKFFVMAVFSVASLRIITLKGG